MALLSETLQCRMPWQFSCTSVGLNDSLPLITNYSEPAVWRGGCDGKLSDQSTGVGRVAFF